MFSRPKAKHLANFFHQLNTLYDAGLPITNTINTLARTVTPRLAAPLRDVSQRLQRGQRLAESLAAHPTCFPPLAVNLVEVGEEAGKLDQVAEELSRYYAWTHALKKRIIAGLIYPAIQVALAIVVIAVFLHLMPRIAPEASPFGPDAAGVFLLVVVAVIAGIVILSKLGGRYMPGRYAFHAFLANAPLIGKLYRKIVLGRFAFVLHLMTASGVDIVKGVQYAGEATGNLVYERASKRVAQKLLAGSGLCDALVATGLFGLEFTSIIEVGEESGRLDDVTLKLAQRYREEAEHAIGVLITIGSFAVWLVVAGFLVAIIILGFMRFYLGAIDAAGKM